jgi:hypothetical protein
MQIGFLTRRATHLVFISGPYRGRGRLSPVFGSPTRGEDSMKIAPEGLVLGLVASKDFKNI